MAASTLCLNAATPSAQGVKLAAEKGAIVPMHAKQLTARTLSSPAKQVRINAVGAPNGHISKQVARPLDSKSLKQPARRNVAKAAAAAASDNAAFSESFEAWDGTEGWLPEGWSMESKGDANLSTKAKWGVDLVPVNYGYPAPPDGNNGCFINFSEEGLAQDEWLISPTVKVNENEMLTFWIFTQPFFYYDVQYVDWETYDFTERHIICDIEVLVKPEGAEWQKCWTLMEQYANTSGYDLLMAGMDFHRQQFSLNEFAGKNVQIAFRYVGTDGDTAILDAISIALPSLDGVCYSAPFETLYWGYDRSPGAGSLGLKIAQYPVLAPISWENTTYNYDATYSWMFHDPVTNDWATSDEQDMLTVTYTPDYTSAFTRRNNMYYLPVLNASAPGTSEGSFTMPHDYLQAGGKPEFEITDTESGTKSIWKTGLLPYEPNTDGLTYLIKDVPEFGDMAMPVFGHNENTDKYWLNVTLNGYEASEGDDVRLEGILNFIYPAAAPLVVNGVHVLGVGQVSEAAEFKIEIFYVSDKYEPVLDDPVATATCSGADIARYDLGTNQLLTIPFDFDAPAVLDNSHVAYIVLFTGFNSPEVTYFAPMQSALPHADFLCHGWFMKKLKIDADFYRTSFSAMCYETGEYGDCYNAFAINLSGHYPWLECETEEIALPQDGTPVTVPFKSYYDGSELTIDCPAGVEATATGRYHEGAITIAHNDAEVIADGELTISAPGVKKTIKVSEVAGITSATADSSPAVAVAAFTPDGKQVNLDNARGGLFIVKYSDGTVRKAIVK